MFTYYRDGMSTYMLGQYVASRHTYISTQTFRRALTASVDSSAEIKGAPAVA